MFHLQNGCFLDLRSYPEKHLQQSAINFPYFNNSLLFPIINIADNINFVQLTAGVVAKSTDLDSPHSSDYVPDNNKVVGTLKSNTECQPDIIGDGLVDSIQTVKEKVLPFLSVDMTSKVGRAKEFRSLSTPESSFCESLFQTSRNKKIRKSKQLKVNKISVNNTLDSCELSKNGPFQMCRLSLKGIYYDRRNHGWQVRIRKRRTEISRYFSAKRYGVEQSYEMALKFYHMHIIGNNPGILETNSKKKYNYDAIKSQTSGLGPTNTSINKISSSFYTKDKSSEIVNFDLWKNITVNSVLTEADNLWRGLYYDNRSHGWQVRHRVEGTDSSKFFSSSKYGEIDALAMALQHKLSFSNLFCSIELIKSLIVKHIYKMEDLIYSSKYATNKIIINGNEGFVSSNDKNEIDFSVFSTKSHNALNVCCQKLRNPEYSCFSHELMQLAVTQVRSKYPEKVSVNTSFMKYPCIVQFFPTSVQYQNLVNQYFICGM
ncbi:AP2 domain-containing protein [Cryptosporidium muris RN66]|uniref:AP2 domain-containing protein n=1 Tax=Cryptosporidium muris (strain RN66) TaxID=441375 RepID=B6ADV2_CRYMR|nr:AP2 domain-containing protein [Cryptosporidium muris RN66]EEA06393.1 AP2 domain-containing protein [Cryptosporidium muris RN66]|eukprot:XP_002140742.1 AP2 domain-containing protein [Cryptosporidium muris RN66]